MFGISVVPVAARKRFFAFAREAASFAASI